MSLTPPCILHRTIVQYSILIIIQCERCNFKMYMSAIYVVPSSIAHSQVEKLNEQFMRQIPMETVTYCR